MGWETGTEPVWFHFKEAQKLKNQRALQVRSLVGQVPTHTASTLPQFSLQEKKQQQSSFTTGSNTHCELALMENVTKTHSQ